MARRSQAGGPFLYLRALRGNVHHARRPVRTLYNWVEAGRWDDLLSHEGAEEATAAAGGTD